MNVSAFAVVVCAFVVVCFAEAVVTTVSPGDVSTTSEVPEHAAMLTMMASSSKNAKDFLTEFIFISPFLNKQPILNIFAFLIL
jgi:hypothetical protein